LRTQRDTATADLAGARQQLEDMKRQAAELDKTVKADKETIQARLSDLAALTEQARALSALRDELEKKAGDAAARVVTEQQRRDAVVAQLADEKKLGDSARAQIALLNRQIEELKAQLSGIAEALQLAKTQNKAKETEIANLTQRLNVALADKVQELQQYRSEFFGRLRAVLANRPGIQVVGDRFVFQSEVLFPVGSADLTPAGVSQITTLAITIKDLMTDIPPDLHWILRVDGHTDPQPLKGGGTFASNWELSAGRAISVVKLLIADGVPADHLAATAFGEYQPFGPGDTPEAYARDRRIELRLTDR
jgi:chemotaxis protein MotB